MATVEDYLADAHPAGVPEQDLLDLIQQELLCREARGESPDADEYRRRFPACAPQVGALFAVNAMLGAPPLASDDDAPALPNYRVEGPLGRGAIGAVFRATDEVLGRPVAVKVLRPEWRDAAGPAARFWAEAEVTARLQHPGIVPVYEAGHDDRDRPYIAMKLVVGQTLDRLLAARPTPAADRARFVQVFEQVCQAVAYAHVQGVIHRDLKPANVMVGEFGEVQVMDWGLAKDTRHETPDTRAEKGPSACPGFRVPRLDRRRRHHRAGDGPGHAGLRPAGAGPRRTPPGRPGQRRVRPRCDPVRDPDRAAAVRHRGPGPGGADTGPARARLAAADADADLIAIARDCLAADPADRPATAAALVEAVAGYRARLAERVRAAELAEARAAAERKARRRTEALRLVGVAVAVAAAAAGWAWVDHQSRLARDIGAAVDDGRARATRPSGLGGTPGGRPRPSAPPAGPRAWPAGWWVTRPFGSGWPIYWRTWKPTHATPGWPAGWSGSGSSSPGSAGGTTWGG